ncbi:MAG: hypothetical protein HQ528_07515 [Candidatus Marinimicrobia bacterium]|nr:hypothetical protein [Candidatus Neomarinimicrobiota bacterium]
MYYRLNFITTTVDQWKRKRIKRFVISLYIIFSCFTGFVLYQSYDSFDYMASVLSEKVTQVKQEISDIEPRVLLLKQKIEKRDQMLQQIKFYTQFERRPSLWHARLLEIADKLPSKMVLDRISYISTNSKGSNKTPEFTITGHVLIRDSERDIHLVDQFRSNLVESQYFHSVYDQMYLKNNNIYKDKDDLKLTFSMVFEK